MAEAHPFFATPGQQIALHLPSSAFFPGRLIRSVNAPEKLMSPIESALRSACSCGDSRARRIGGGRAEPRSGQAGAKTVRRKLRGLPSQPARAGQRPLSPHALSVSAKTLFQQFEFGLGADVLSGIHRQRKARRGEVGRQRQARRGHALLRPPARCRRARRGFARSVTTCSPLCYEISSTLPSFRPLPA